MSGIYELPGHLIRRLHQISVSVFAAEIAAAGIDLTPVQFAALRTLQDNEGVEQATLAGLIACDKATIGGVVARLEARGLIARKVSPSDRRARVLGVTEAGAALLRQVMPAVERAQEVMLQGLAADERETLVALMRKLTEAENDRSRAPLRTPPPAEPS